MRRRLAKTSLFLASGVALNVAVAWLACATADHRCSIDCILEGDEVGSDKVPARSRYADAGICVERSAWRTRFSVIVLGGYSGGWREVHDLEAEVSDWADAYLSDAVLSQLREYKSGSRQRLIEAGGWPCLSLSGGLVIDWTRSNSHVTIAEREWTITLPPLQPRNSVWKSSVAESRILPLRPVWPGFAIDTILYAAALWLGGLASSGLRGAIRRRNRLQRGMCPHCAYPIGESAVCTECGKPVTPSPAPERAGSPAVRAAAPAASPDSSFSTIRARRG